MPSGARNPIDSFIQTRRAKEGLNPSPEADRRTLLRRVRLDLTGLAPEPAQIEAFVKDKSPDAYQKVVDRLLASQAYAEHQAVPWLDAVRYADPAGFNDKTTLDTMGTRIVRSSTSIHSPTRIGM